MDSATDEKNSGDIQGSSPAMTESSEIRMTNAGGDEVSAGGVEPHPRGSTPQGSAGENREIPDPATGDDCAEDKANPNKTDVETICLSTTTDNFHSTAMEDKDCSNSDRKFINSTLVQHTDIQNIKTNCSSERNDLPCSEAELSKCSANSEQKMTSQLDACDVDNIDKAVLTSEDAMKSKSRSDSSATNLDRNLQSDAKLNQAAEIKEEVYSSKTNQCNSPLHESYGKDRKCTTEGVSYKVTNRICDSESELPDRICYKSQFLSHPNSVKPSYNDDKCEHTQSVCSQNIDLKSHKSLTSSDAESAQCRPHQPLTSRSSPDPEKQDPDDLRESRDCAKMTSSNSCDVVDRHKLSKTPSVEMSPPPNLRVKMESPIIEEKATTEQGFGESHVNKLMSFVDSLDRKTSNSHHRLSSSLFTSPLNKQTSGSLPERSNSMRSSEHLYRPYKTSPAPLKNLTGKTSGGRADGKTENSVDQPLDLSVNKKSDSRDSPSLSPQNIPDYNGSRNPFGLSSLESMRAMFGEGSPMIPSVSGKSGESSSKQNTWSGVANYPANINWQFASSLASLQAQMEAMLMSYPLFKASMDFYKTMMPPYVPNVASTSEKSANSPAHSTTGGNASSSLHGKDKLKRPNEYEKRSTDTRTPNGQHRRSPAVSSSGVHSTRRGSEATGYSADVKRSRTDSVPWLPSHSKPSSDKPSLSVGERKAFYAQACRKSSAMDENRSSSKVQSSLEGRKATGGEPATSSSDEPRAEADERTMLTSFACGCGRRFASLYQLTVHIEESGHSPSQVRVDSVDDFPKLVRGQDLWLSGGQDQRDQTLRCIRCKESFRSLPELTVHMIKSKHYVDIVGQGGDLERPLLPENDLLWKLHRPHSQNRYRNNSGNSSKEGDEQIKWTCAECLKSYSYEEDLNKHLTSSGHQMVNYGQDHRSLRKSEAELGERQKADNFSPHMEHDRMDRDVVTPRAASSGSVDDKDLCKEQLRSSSGVTPLMRPSSVQSASHTEYSSPTSKDESSVVRGDKGRLSTSPHRKSGDELSRSPLGLGRSKSPGFEANVEQNSGEDIIRSNSYYNDYISYKLKRPLNHSPSPVKNKRIKTEPNDDETRAKSSGDDGYRDDYRTSTPGMEGRVKNSPVRESGSPKDDSSKGYMNLMCPPVVEATDSSSTLKAMESFVERSFSSGKFSSPLSLSQNNLAKLGNTSYNNSHSNVYKSRSPVLDRSQLLKPYNTASHSVSSENKGSTLFKDYTRTYEHADAKWLTRDKFSNRIVTDDTKPSKSHPHSSDHSTDGLLMIKQKKANSLGDPVRSEVIPTHFLNSSSPKMKLSSINNDRKDISKSLSQDKYKADRTTCGNVELNHKNRQFTSSTLEYLQHFVDDAALKPTNSRDGGKKSLMSSEGKLSIKIKAATANC